MEMLYNYIKEKHYEDRIQEDQVEKMFDFLKIDNFANVTLHTLIFLKMLQITNYLRKIPISLINYLLD